MPELIIVKTSGEYLEAASLFEEYTLGLKFGTGFRVFSEYLYFIEEEYAPPKAEIILYKIEKRFIGCIAICKNSPTVCELENIYVQPDYRKKGIGKILLTEAVALAKKLNYTTIRLYTLDIMNPAANKLSKQAGFVITDPFYDNIIYETLFYELIIA